MDEKFFAKLKLEYEQITDELSKITEPRKLKSLTRRHIELTRILEKIEELNKLRSQLKESRTMLTDPQDEELLKLANEDVAKLEERLPIAEGELKKLLIPHDPADSGEAILEIRAGTGGEEAAPFWAELVRMDTRFAERKGIGRAHLCTPDTVPSRM